MPALPSRDLDATVASSGAIGFEIVSRDDAWLILRRGDLALELVPRAGPRPRSSGAICVVPVADVDAPFDAIRDGTQLQLVEDATELRRDAR